MGKGKCGPGGGATGELIVNLYVVTCILTRPCINLPRTGSVIALCVPMSIWQYGLMY